ncbi:RAD55 family ATPase [Methanofollis fontis]|uniref:KaiC-like domain-containing protein n=1 Tax=Methanofollis fontis TaxID=2052832 RepID=A0A483CWT3_9EURY|nr:hypothetical protein [Methanofollis fontis]TAJ43403.1 hypothetical protein CUJ86_11120 [Methanofollis fontis]
MDPFRSGIEKIDGEIGGIRPGSNILLLAPPFADAERLAYFLTEPGDSDYTIVISTDQDAQDIVASYNLPDSASHRLWIIDCITKTMTPTVPDEEQVKFVGSPVDLTGMGIKFTKILDAIQRTESANATIPGTPRIRVCINSLSSFLVYTKLESIYRFFHILSARIRRMNGIAVYILNPEGVDEKTLSTLKQLMNGLIEVKEDENDPGLHTLRFQMTSGGGVSPVRYRFSGNDLVVET